MTDKHTETKADKILRRVRAMLAKADSTEFEGEAKTFRAEAERLMSVYRIEQWQLEVGSEEKEKPEVREFETKWFFRMGSASDPLWQMFHDVARHCRCKVIYWQGVYETPVIGLPADLDYMDLLFTSLLMQVTEKINPAVDPEQSYIENLVRLKEAGFGWRKIYNKLSAAGFDFNPDPDRPAVWTRSIGVKFTRDYSAFCKENNREQLRTTPDVYRRSYAEGFKDEISWRLFQMRDEQKDKEETSGMELVVRDIMAQLDEEATNLFGSPPESKSVSRDLASSAMARSAGAGAGARADITTHQNRRVSGRKEIEA